MLIKNIVIIPHLAKLALIKRSSFVTSSPKYSGGIKLSASSTVGNSTSTNPF